MDREQLALHMAVELNQRLDEVVAEFVEIEDDLRQQLGERPRTIEIAYEDTGSSRYSTL